ncbi:acetyl esterase family enzyme [Lachnospiraceae bacterium KM106-2]|nr:acetyl esterase family enzyme [Lachnospiraceae bacterium KM106-2]
MRIQLEVPYTKAGLSGEGLNPYLDCYVTPNSDEIGKKKRKAMVICPGGGYEFTSDREADIVAIRYQGYGLQTFVLRYSIVNKPFPTALLELATAVATVREHADEWDIDPEQILVCGFSAGGHLAASLAVHWDKDFVKNPLGFKEEHKPNGLVLGYPVIVSGKDTHEGSMINLIGKDPSEKLKQLASLDKQVGKQVPPTFLWHTVEDDCVPVTNSLKFATALKEADIPFEMHLFPHGGHGLSFADYCTSVGPEQYNDRCKDWFELSVKWIYGGM